MLTTFTIHYAQNKLFLKKRKARKNIFSFSKCQLKARKGEKRRGNKTKYFTISLINKGLSQEQKAASFAFTRQTHPLLLFSSSSFFLLLLLLLLILHLHLPLLLRLYVFHPLCVSSLIFIPLVLSKLTD